MSTAHDCKTECSLLLRLDKRGVRRAGRWFRFPLDATEFFGIGEDDVHVLDCQLELRLSSTIAGTLSKASICPVICRPSFRVTLIR